MNDIVILSMMLEGPKHGYQLKHEAGIVFGPEALHNNLIYPLLRRFLEEGWVSKKEVPGKRGQTRLQYTLTVAGRRSLLNRLSEFGDADAASEPAFRTRVALFDLLDIEARKNILERREKYLQPRQQRLAGLAAHVSLGKYGREVVEHLRQEIALEIKWIKHMRRISQVARKKLPAERVPKERGNP